MEYSYRGLEWNHTEDLLIENFEENNSIDNNLIVPFYFK